MKITYFQVVAVLILLNENMYVLSMMFIRQVKVILRRMNRLSSKNACVSFHDYDLFLTNGPTKLR